ncbi:MAG: tRNA (adenosine(37)-N6)-threonylcarbamoyltransferase complex ATPase subunit type 1 TsaE [Planctomycetota bacterium]
MDDRVILDTVLPSLDATDAFAHTLASWVEPSDVLALRGELGAGKTTLTRLLGAAMGADERGVNSPTFVIAMEHATADGMPGLVHVDAYRVGDESELDAMGWDRLTAPDRVVVIEWPDRIPEAIEALGERVLHVELWPESETARGVRMTTSSPRFTDRPWPVASGETSSDEHREDTTCPVTGRAVPADSPTWPFADERARMADLYQWFSEGYRIERPIEERDMEEG